MAFDLALFMDELGEACLTVPDLNRSVPYPAERIEPPTAVVGWPESIEYDKTYGGLQHDYSIPVYLVISLQGTARTRRDVVARWLSRDVKLAIDGFEYTDRPVVVVTEAELDNPEVAGQVYLAVRFTVQVTSTT